MLYSGKGAAGPFPDNVAAIQQLKAILKLKLQLPPKLEPKIENHPKLTLELVKKALEWLTEWWYTIWHSLSNAHCMPPSCIMTSNELQIIYIPP